MTRRTKLVGWLLYRLRELLNEHRWRIVTRSERRTERLFGYIMRLDRHPGESYWRRRDRG